MVRAMTIDHLAAIERDSNRLADIAATGDPSAPIAGCPGWTLHGLVEHMGSVQRWARQALLTAAPPKIDPADDPAPSDAAGIAQWLRDGAERLLTTLRDTDPAASTWHPFPVEPKVAGLWRRRQSQEVFVHRIDGELAVGVAPHIDAELAADGVDEYWTVMLPRMLTREQRTTPSSVLQVKVGDRVWTVDGSSGLPVPAPQAAPAATISGSAPDMLLRLWGRPVTDGAVQIEGDAQVAADWLALGGS